MAKRPPTDPQLLWDTLNPGSSTGWTDEKHMLYITSLEESFVNQLYSGNLEINSTKAFYRTPGVWQETSYGGNSRNTKYDQEQGYWGMVQVDEAESRLSEVGYIGAPPYSGGSPYYMDDASTNGPRQEITSYHARQRTSGGCTAFHLRQHGHSLSWRTENCPFVQSRQARTFLTGRPKVARNKAEGLAKTSKNMLVQPRSAHLEAKVYISRSFMFRWEVWVSMGWSM